MYQIVYFFTDARDDLDAAEARDDAREAWELEDPGLESGFAVGLSLALPDLDFLPVAVGVEPENAIESYLRRSGIWGMKIDFCE